MAKLMNKITYTTFFRKYCKKRGPLYRAPSLINQTIFFYSALFSNLISFMKEPLLYGLTLFVALEYSQIVK